MSDEEERRFFERHSPSSKTQRMSDERVSCTPVCDSFENDRSSPYPRCSLLRSYRPTRRATYPLSPKKRRRLSTQRESTMSSSFGLQKRRHRSAMMMRRWWWKDMEDVAEGVNLVGFFTGPAISPCVQAAISAWMATIVLTG